MSHTNHRAQAAIHRDPNLAPIRCAVITVSDTRTEETDRSGSLIRNRLAQHGHEVSYYRIVPDEPKLIGQVVDGLAGKVDVVLLSGGTGISTRDRTYETIDRMLEKRLPGFGELFRMLSYEEVGAAAMLSRAVGGVYSDTLYFSMPGSLGAVKLALDKLILPEIRHLVWEIVRQQDPDAAE